MSFADRLQKRLQHSNRELFLQQVRQHFPELYHWVLFCYGSDSSLWWYDHRISSSQDTQQGDPLGPLLFALVLHPAILKLKEQWPTEIQIWYLDDGNILIDFDMIPHFLNILVNEAATNGLSLNLDKCSLYSPDQPEFTSQTGNIVFSDDLKVPYTTSGVRVLGIPIGSPVFVNDFVSKKMVDYGSLLDTIQVLQDPHEEFFLFKNCFGSAD